MGDSYDNVMENLQLEKRRSRARVIVELMGLYGWLVSRDKREPRWLHVLRRKATGSQAPEGAMWEGKIKTLKRSVVEAETRTKEEVRAVKAKVSAVEAKVSSVEMHMTNLEGKLDRILELLASHDEAGQKSSST